MRHDPPHPPRRRRVQARLLAVSLSAGAAGFGIAPAHTAQEPPPEGISVGSWILAPSVVVGYARDSNVFYLGKGSGAGPLSDSLTRVDPSLRATLPFRNSRFGLAYQATRLDYGTARLDRKWAQQLSGELSLLFSRFDRLTLGASRTKGIAETLRFDPGGETVFRGSGYDLDSLNVELKREVSGRRGYRLSVVRDDLAFAPGTAVSFFDYRGFDGRAEYMEPLSPRLWVMGVYETRRYDHFLANDPSPQRKPFRRERSDLVWTGFRGLARERSPFQVLVGRAVARFPGGAGSDFRGLIADASLGLQIGGGSNLTVTASRRPWPSFFFDNNYYLSESVGLRFERRWLRASAVGFALTTWRNRYPDLVPLPGSPTGLVRRVDDTWSGEGYATVMVHPRLGFRASVTYQNRDSPYESAEYRKTVFFGGVTLGWF